jgi:nucleoside-diphosphate-sugar epimerase
MITGAKILVTGGQGPSGFPVARDLAASNEVWVLARHSDPEKSSKLEAAGIQLLRHDLSDPFDDLPDDFAYVYHSAIVSRAPAGPWPRSFDVNVDVAARLIEHCRAVQGFVVVSSASIYATGNHGAPIRETDPLGLHTVALGDHGHYSFSKYAIEEAVGYVCRMRQRPVTILRMGSPYGPAGGTVAERLERIVRGEEIVLHPDRPNLFRPMFDTDVARLAAAAMEAARVPALVVNFCGDETVSAEEYCEYLGELVGRTPRFRYTTEGTYDSLVPDTELMHEVLGRCQVGWREGCRRVVEARHPELLS